jgi:RHS repeat-associated protein
MNQQGHIQFSTNTHQIPFGEDWVDQHNSSWNSPYTFSGKEKDAETGYGYFGARYYDSGLSIWLSVDPMCDKYPSMSPYNYCANNPVILVDPDGRIIIIPYKVKDAMGNETTKLFHFNGRNVSEAPNDPFVQNFIKAYEYDVYHGGGEKLRDAAESTTIKIRLIYKEGDSSSGFQFWGKPGATFSDYSQEPTVTWDPYCGYKTTDGVIISPASALEEEFNHCMQMVTNPTQYWTDLYDTKDKKYDNAEEKRVKQKGTSANITIIKNKEAKEGWYEKDHKGTKYSKTKWKYLGN